MKVSVVNGESDLCLIEKNNKGGTVLIELPIIVVYIVNKFDRHILTDIRKDLGILLL